jgi:hypothetical protein
MAHAPRVHYCSVRKYLLLCTFAVLACRENASRSLGVEAGALVALSSGRTLLLAGDSAQFVLAAERRPILVARDNDLYWVGTVARCGIDTAGTGSVREQEFASRREDVFVVRAGDSVTVSMNGRECTAVENDVRRLRARRDSALSDSVRRDAPSEPTESSELYCDLGWLNVTFVSPTVLSYQLRARTTEFCNPGGYSTSGWNVVRQLTTNDRLALSRLLPAEAWTQVRRALVDSTNGCSDSDRIAEQLDSTWSITRGRGAWMVQYWLEGATACRGGQDVDFEELAVDSLTHELKLPIPWDSLRIQLPRVEDASSSPSGKYILVKQADSLAIVRFVAGRVGPPLVSIPMSYDERFVMIRWLRPDEMKQVRERVANARDPRVIVKPTR